MKKLFCVGIFISLMACQQAFALLPPLAQSVSEMRALLSSPEISQNLKSSEKILQIQRTDSAFVITTNASQMTVEIDYQPSSRPGPQEFKFTFHPPIPLQARW